MWDKVLEKVCELFGPGVREFREKQLKKQLEDKMKSLQAQFKNPALYEYLMYRYASCYPILKRNDKVFPVVIFPQDSLQPKLSYPNLQDRPKEGKIHSTNYRKFKEKYDERVSNINVKECKKEFKDIATYTMLEFNENNGILQCSIGQYDDMLDSCDVLEYELLAILAQGHTKPQKIDKKTILRKKLHSLVSDPVRFGKGRVCGLGISALLVFKDEVNLKILLLRRSTKTVGLHAGLTHVIPSGILQSIGNLENDLNPQDNILKEYAEELFNLPDHPKDYSPVDIHTHIQKYECVRYLKKLLNQGSASLTITGLAVNLINLRPEICMLLFINNPEWWDTHTSRNGKKDMEFKFNDEVFKNLLLPYSDNDNVLLKEICPEKTIPPGAAAFWLGIDKLRKKIKS